MGAVEAANDNLRIGPGHRDFFGMFTDAGNGLVAKLVRGLLEDVTVHYCDDAICLRLNAGFHNIERRGHDEVWDTDVRRRAAYRIERATGRRLSACFRYGG